MKENIRLKLGMGAKKRKIFNINVSVICISGISKSILIFQIRTIFFFIPAFLKRPLFNVHPSSVLSSYVYVHINVCTYMHSLSLAYSIRN